MLSTLGLFLTTFLSPKYRFDIHHIGSICLIPYPDNTFELCDDSKYSMLEYIDKKAFGPKKLIVPMTFKTDLASIPRVLWPLYAPTDYDTLSPAILHDYFYACPNGYSRKQIDDMFYYALKDSGLNTWAAQKFWLAVRFFGHDSFSEGLECYGSDIIQILYPKEIFTKEYEDEEENEEVYVSEKEWSSKIAKDIAEFENLEKNKESHGSKEIKRHNSNAQAGRAYPKSAG